MKKGRSAEGMDADSRYERGNRYRYGVPADPVKAMKWYRLASDLGHAGAQCEVGYCYYSGDGVKKDLKKAKKWLTLAADNGDENARRKLTWLLYEDKESDPEETVMLLKAAAEKEGDLANYILGMMYKEGDRVPQDDEEAVRRFKAASSEEGYWDANYELGLMYETGEGVPQNDDEAIFWYKRAVDRSCTDPEKALHRLCAMYAEGKKIFPNDKEMVEWFGTVAGYAFPEAKYQLGYFYDNGIGVRKNSRTAMIYYKYAALFHLNTEYDPSEQNSDEAHKIGCFYRDGTGVPIDHGVAARWFRIAADDGYMFAQNDLGCLYEDGNGVPQSDKEAVKWYRRAANQGDEIAEYNLGRMYRDGKGVPQSNENAMKWFGRAAEKGHKGSKKALKKMKKHTDDGSVHPH